MGKKEEWKKEQPADFDLSLWPSVFVLLACFSASALSEITRLIMMDQCTFISKTQNKRHKHVLALNSQPLRSPKEC